MQTTLSNDLPARLGARCLENLQRLAAPTTLYHVQPGNTARIPCFVSGLKVMFLDGAEDRGVVIVKGATPDMRLQRIDGASGVASRRPCFIPIDGMHGDVSLDVRGVAAPHLVRVSVFAVIDEHGIVHRSSGLRDSFPGAGQEAYLFPHGIHHRTGECHISPDIAHGLTMSGMIGGRTSQLTPIVGPQRDVRGVPVLGLHAHEPIRRIWE